MIRIVLVALLAVGCASTGKKNPVTGPFPTAAAIEQILAAAPDPVPEVFDPETWAIGEEGNAVECLAAELARLDAEGEPSADLFEWVRARCGVWSRNVYTALGTESEAAQMMQERVPEANRHRYEVATAVSGDAVRVVIVERLARVDARGLETNKVQLVGAVYNAGQDITAFVNRGRFGVTHCQKRESLSAPDFEFVCELDSDDEWAWIEITSRKLADPDPVIVASLLAGTPPREYTRPHLIRELEAVGTTRREQLTALLNQVRKEGYLKPVELVVAQSEATDRIAAHMNDHEATLRLSALAGRELEHTVRYARVCSTKVPEAALPVRVLASLLERPTSRVVLLDPDVSQVAVGGAGAAHVAAGYAVLKDGGPDTRADVVWEYILQKRRSAGKSTPRRIRGLDNDVARAIELMEVEGASAGRALQVFIHRAGVTLSRRASGWYVEVSSLEDFEIPDRLLASPLLEMEIAVAYATGDNSAWGRYVILVVTVAAIPT